MPMSSRLSRPTASANCTPRSPAPHGPKTYVQHLVAAEKEKVWRLIEQGAIVFVCGDGGRMEPDVKAALVSIYRERTGADADAGARWIEDMGTKNRYVLDVWAGG